MYHIKGGEWYTTFLRLSGNLTATVENLVDCLKRRDNLLPMQAAKERKKLELACVGYVSEKKNVRVDELACVGHGRC